MTLVSLTKDDGAVVFIHPGHIVWVTADTKVSGHTLVALDQAKPFLVLGDVGSVVAAINAALA